MDKWIAAATLLVGILAAPGAFAATQPGCLSTDPGSITWTLPTIPVGKSWSFTAPAYDDNDSPGEVEVTVWRHACSDTNSQVVITLTPVSSAPYFGQFTITQSGYSGQLLDLIVNAPDVVGGNQFYPDGSRLPAALSGLVDPHGGLGFFDPNQPFTLSYAATYPLGNTAISSMVDVPAYNHADTRFSIGNNITGDWYNQAQSGQGFSLQVLPGNRLHAQWYVFSPQGGPLWIAADGPINGDSATLQAYTVDGPGALFPPGFDSSAVKASAWGTFKFTFTDCKHGTASWQPTVQGFSAGSESISHLSLPAGLTCP